MDRDEYNQLIVDTSELIAVRSANPPGNEYLAAAWLEARLAAVASTEVQLVTDGRANLVARFDFGPGPALMFCTHLDVVPVSAETQWEPQIRDGRLFGRGACDAKGTLAAMIAACLRLRSDPSGIAGSVILAAVADEESGALGALTLVERGVRADAAIIGEPTSNRPVFASRGAVRLGVTFHGRSAHASDPSNGVNALYVAARFILEIERYHGSLIARGSLSSAAATVVSGGSRLNVIPDECTVLIDRRVGPTETCSAAAAEVEALAQAVAMEAQNVTTSVEPAGVWLEPFEIPLTTALARSVLGSLPSTLPGPVFNGGTDAPHLIAAGIPSVIIGPGSLQDAHTAAEYVDLAELAEAVSTYERIARSFLARAGNPVADAIAAA